VGRILPAIDRAFFEEYARGEPEQVAAQWEGWLRAKRHRPDGEAVYRKLMEICSGLGEGSVRNYLKGRHYSLSDDSLDVFDRISQALKQPTARRVEIPPEAAGRHPRSNRIALLTQLQVPSESYHMELIRGIVREANLHHLAIGLHEVSSLDVGASIERVRVEFRPDGIVMLRVTPSLRDLEPLVKSRTPVVLVHADRYRYPPPVLANIVPNQDGLEEDLQAWIKRYRRPASEGGRRKRGAAGKAVLVTMPREVISDVFPRMKANIEPSIRNDRIARLERVLRRRFHPVIVEEVPDYRFRHSLGVFQHHRDADLYVSLSDQIAVGLKHMLIAAGQPWDQRIVGFDDSPMAQEESLTSFSQSLEKIGFLAMSRMCGFLRRDEGQWPEFEELSTDVHLEIRCARE
jgi:DNA-binding LacI/PurR family transcriptional regulator